MDIHCTIFFYYIWNIICPVKFSFHLRRVALQTYLENDLVASLPFIFRNLVFNQNTISNKLVPPKQPPLIVNHFATQVPAHQCVHFPIFQEHGISPHPYIEFYKNDKIYFVAPLDKNKDFYVPEYEYAAKKEELEADKDE